jgi:hypothetical protein
VKLLQWHGNRGASELLIIERRTSFAEIRLPTKNQQQICVLKNLVSKNNFLARLSRWFRAFFAFKQHIPPQVIEYISHQKSTGFIVSH